MSKQNVLDAFDCMWEEMNFVLAEPDNVHSKEYAEGFNAGVMYVATQIVAKYRAKLEKVVEL